MTKDDLIKITDFLWEIPKSYRADMRVPGRIFASETMLPGILSDRSLVQLVNVATLPGIKKAALALPDIHEGYGFPIGGVAAIDLAEGIISPGGIGYDINCGVRLLASSVSFTDLKPSLPKLADELFKEIPSGVGQGGYLKLKIEELDQVLTKGALWLVENGYGKKEDLSRTESEGSLKEADPKAVSDHAKKRGLDQLGTMGAGNHFVEVDSVAEIFEEKAAAALGLRKDQVVILIHTGSRGLGHQVATDYIQLMIKAMAKYQISLPDRELAGAPFSSPEGEAYFKAMSAAANFAWANRQLITWAVRRAWDSAVGRSDLSVVYDVAHNIAKIEEHLVNNHKERVLVHRKGATRAFPDQPVIIPGSMGTASFVLLGTEKSMTESFGSTCHGAGRAMSRHAALQKASGKQIKQDLEGKNILVRTRSVRNLAEEADYAYKEIESVVEVVAKAGIARKVCRLKPLIVVKG